MTVLACLLLLLQPPGLAASLQGVWSGTMEYRDYRSDRRVTLPTKLVVSQSGTVLEFAYEYDDGPEKTVRSRDRISIDAAAGTYRIQSGDGSYDATFAVAGLADFGTTTSTVVLTGTGTENDQPVDLRITLTVTASQMTMERQSRRAGADWMFRNRYDLKRAN